MASSLYPSPNDRAMFAIARDKARTDAERATVDALLAQLAAIGVAEDAAVARHHANRLARGERSRLPTDAELAAIDAMAIEAVMDPAIREHLCAQPRAADVLRSLAWAYTTVPMVRLANQRFHHPDGWPIEKALIDAHRAFADAVFDFIGDPGFRREAGFAAARQSLDCGGGAIFVVFEATDALPDIDGKALSRHFDRLDELASTAGVMLPGSYLGLSGAGSADWFDAADGLRTVEALRAAIRPGSVRLKDKTALRDDLDALAETLQSAQALGVRFHLEVDV